MAAAAGGLTVNILVGGGRAVAYLTNTKRAVSFVTSQEAIFHQARI